MTQNQILIGNTNTSILQSSNLSWNNTSNTLSASNFVGSGSGITNLDYNNILTNKPDLTIYAVKTNVDSSLNTINNTLSNKQNIITVSTPLNKDVSNNITIDLSGYLLSSTASSTYATITNLNTKQNIFSCISPLIKNDISNNISIDLSSHHVQFY